MAAREALPPGGNESYYKNHLEQVVKENTQLKQKLDQLERENRDLKHSVYELNCSMGTNARKAGAKHFNLDAVFPSGASATAASVSDAASYTKEISEEAMPNTSDNTGRRNDKKFLHYKYDIKTHVGSVYAVKFSKCGRWLASGSFDKTVRLYDLELSAREVTCLTDHSLHVTDLSWSESSKFLLSGAYDQTVRLWDVDATKLLTTFTTTGFLQSVMFDPANENLFWCGTTQNLIEMYDKRQQTYAVRINNAGWNSIQVSGNGQTLLSGDQHGLIKVWDVRELKSREPRCVWSLKNDEAGKPISAIVISDAEPGDEVGRYVAVNSYDNVLRVYQLKSNLELRLLHSVQGHKNKNWPIKSAFFAGEVPRKKRTNIKHDDSTMGEADRDKPSEETNKSLLLATGSADNSCYCFDVGGPEGSAELMQKLEGHSDRVYSCHFNPCKPMLATCSADSVIKIWTPKTSRQVQGSD